ncbi:WD40 repeat-like protein [Sanghuangporus baumii]|uniref:WD40 repeat-like protein n=1 Tax=Sanghuangporus baumii TaxID=108892 RepID=A0A9Q5NA70_SANBA|nr:WD40 repeat-like protein [Sanghuangporus baumii]
MVQDENSTNEESQAWYDSLENIQPFRFEVKVSNYAFSLGTLWNGEFSSEPNKLAQWQKIFRKWSGVVAVGGGAKLRLFLSRPRQQYLPICEIEVPQMVEEADISCTAWCMVQNADEFWPLIAFSANSLLYLYNVEKANYHGILRGHGGKITSLAVHPADPCILASTSYDQTCRIYDLTKRASGRIDNPHWPGQTRIALAGAPFGLRSNEPEGIDYGRCAAILVGGPSGGHVAPVLGAAFHPSFPVIATCGMDRAVKIWNLPEMSTDRICREERPLFSSTAIHDAQILSISWMSKDMLLSSCGESLVRLWELSPTPSPGTLVLWKWLGFDRFFPLDREAWSTVHRGCASDFQESSSYKVIAKYNLPSREASTCTFVFQSPAHAPIITLPSLGGIYMSSVRHFKPRSSPSFGYRIEELAEATNKLDLNAENRVCARADQNLPCWLVEVTKDGEVERFGNNEDEVREITPRRLKACEISANGCLLIGVGDNESIWIWRIPDGKQVRRVSTSDETR